MNVAFGMSLFIRFLSLSDAATVIAGRLAIMLMVLVTFFSVVGRWVFGTSIPDDIAISEILMVMVVYIPLAHVQHLGQHIEISVLSDLLPEKVQSLLTTIGLILGLIFVSITAWVTTGNAVQSYLDDDIFYASLYDIPVWPAKFLIPIGLWWWVLRLAVQLFLPSLRPAKAGVIEQAVSEAENEAQQNERHEG